MNGDFVDSIYPIDLEINDSTYIARPISYLQLRFDIDSEGQLRTKL